MVAAWAAARALPLHAHVSEQPAENEACLEVYGATPVELFHFEGALPERFTAVHATHVTERDIALLGEAGAFCCLCPTTERALADGIGPARRLREAGCALTIGTRFERVDRAVRGGARRRARRAARDRRARGDLGAGRCWRPRPATGTQPRVGFGWGDPRGGARGPGRRVDRRRPPRRDAGRRPDRRRRVRGRRGRRPRRDRRRAVRRARRGARVAGCRRASWLRRSPVSAGELVRDRQHRAAGDERRPSSGGCATRRGDRVRGRAGCRRSSAPGSRRRRWA